MTEADRHDIAEAIVQRLETSTDTSALLTLPEVAEALRCWDKSVRRMVKDGRLSAFKIAERILFRRQEVEDLVTRSRVSFLS